MGFSIGEKVRFVHETGYGIIKKELSHSKYLVENESGIELTILKVNLVKIHSEDYKEKVIIKDTIKTVSNGNIASKINGLPEIDLHLEQDLVAINKMTNAEILLFQLRKADEFTQKMIERRIEDFVIIHGVGEGVLKSEIRMLLTKYSGVQTTDADFKKYGQGATLVSVNYKLR
ncbi:MAG: Smr/MutS family protein [Bacteroidota bacterium]